PWEAGTDGNGNRHGLLEGLLSLGDGLVQKHFEGPRKPVLFRITIREEAPQKLGRRLPLLFIRITDLPRNDEIVHPPGQREQVGTVVLGGSLKGRIEGLVDFVQEDRKMQASLN